METLIIQIGLRQGRNADIYKLNERELYVGRAYSNDIVLTDPYVAPQQLRIYRYGMGGDDLSWHINILDATNPVLVNGDPVDSATQSVCPGDSITVGRTTMRLYSDEHEVEPTRKLLVSSWLHKAAKNAWIPVCLFALVCLTDSFLNYGFSNTDGEWKEHGISTIAGMGLLLGWAGFWSIVGRVLRHQPHFSYQLLVTTLIAAIGLTQTPIELFAEFLTDSTQVRTVIAYGFGTVLLGYLLHYNLFFATNIKHTAMLACCFSVGLSLLVFLFSISEENEFSSVPQYSGTVLPPVVNPREAKSLDDYIESFGKTFADSNEQ
ncbi:MAG: FHA domain-containing protein [Pseudomonadota bacterium]